MEDGGEPTQLRNIPGLPPQEAEALADTSAPDTASAREAEQLSSGRTTEDLEADARAKDHARNQKFKDHFERLLKHGLDIAFVVGVAFGLTWAWHMIAPSHLHWLDEAHIDRLQNLVAGGVLATFAAELFRKRIG